jgi:hypothetical protein
LYFPLPDSALGAFSDTTLMNASEGSESGPDLCFLKSKLFVTVACLFSKRSFELRHEGTGEFGERGKETIDESSYSGMKVLICVSF